MTNERRGIRQSGRREPPLHGGAAFSSGPRDGRCSVVQRKLDEDGWSGNQRIYTSLDGEVSVWTARTCIRPCREVGLRVPGFGGICRYVSSA
jgi:hypothetical protein